MSFAEFRDRKFRECVIRRLKLSELSEVVAVVVQNGVGRESGNDADCTGLVSNRQHSLYANATMRLL
jgi:histidinol phosphatase-like enzyme